MIVRDQPPELSPEDEADLVSFVDGHLDADGRARVEARAAKDPDYKSALLRQQVGRDAVTSAAESTGAPLALKARVEEMGAARGRHKGEKRSGVRTRLGTFGEVAYALAPKAVDQILHMAYKVFPESTKKKEGEKDGPGDRASGEAMALAHLMKGVHW